MNPNIQYIRIEKTEGIEKYILLKLARVHVWGTQDPHFYVWLECEKSKADIGGPLFRCAIEVDGLKGNKKYFVEKKDTDFYTCVHKAIDAIETIFRRDKGTFRNKQRRQLKRLQREDKVAS